MKDWLIYILTGLICLLILIFLHEQTHISINQAYGISSDITLKDFPTIAVTPTCTTQPCLLAQNINDLVSYNLTAVFLIVYVSLIIKSATRKT